MDWSLFWTVMGQVSLALVLGSIPASLAIHMVVGAYMSAKRRAFENKMLPRTAFSGMRDE